jgi:enoyl-CoA hydratase/carnithine racemase
MRYTTRLLPSRSGNMGILMLNNPEKLHALSLDMIQCMQDVLQQWYQDDSMMAILLKSPPTKKVPAFCSGGDVKQVYLSGIETKNSIVHGQGAPGVDTAEFFRQEYQVNHMLATATKPHVSFWDGIVMGGGVGISIHSRYRVATENTVWAMPETAIGLFPDVGSMYWMPRMLQSYPGLATYLACTGQRLKASDLVATGLATHYVPSNKLPFLEAALISASASSSTLTDNDVVAPVLNSFNESPTGDSALDRGAIALAFGHQASMESIFEALDKMQKDDSNDFARATLSTLQKMSPTSLKVTLEGLRRGGDPTTTPSITNDLQMEFRMSQAFMRSNSDFYEGIRAVLIDKDHNPKWNPNHISKMPDDDVTSYFAPIAHEWAMPRELLEIGTVEKEKSTETSRL